MRTRGLNWKREAGGLLLIFLAVVVFLALASYNAVDNPGAERPEEGYVTRNWIGSGGAFVAWGLRWLLGWAAVTGTVLWLAGRFV